MHKRDQIDSYNVPSRNIFDVNISVLVLYSSP